MNSQCTGTLVSPSASTVVLPVQQCYWQYTLDQGPDLENEARKNIGKWSKGDVFFRSFGFFKSNTAAEIVKGG